jgi:RNA polymerase sigma factor (sigma-70 family)
MAKKGTGNSPSKKKDPAAKDEYKTRYTLLQKVKDQQDEQSWAEFVNYYRRYIYAIIMNMQLPHHDCEDLSQAVLLKAWKKLPEFKYDPGKGKFRGWITTVTKNTVRDFYDKKNRSKESTTKDGDTALMSRNMVSLPDIDDIAEKEWQTFMSRMAWENVEGSLAPKVRETFIRLLKGDDVKTIADALEIAENTVYQYKSRVQKLLYKEVVRLEYELG